MGRAEANSDAGHASDRLNDAHELRRAKCAAEILEPRRKIGDPYGATFVVEQLRHYDCGIAHII